MPDIAFQGFVLPLHRHGALHRLPQITFTIAKSGLKAVINTQIKDGVVFALCSLNRDLQENELERVYVRVYETVRTSLDFRSFATGKGFTLVINKFTNSLGVVTDIVIENQSLGSLCKSFNLDDSDFNDTLFLFLQDAHLSWALRDLIEANTLPNHASINCARAVEALRVLMTGAETPRPKARGDFQSALRISREYREYITDISTGPRHGDRKPIGRDVSDEITRRAWIIMDRYITFKKRGSQPLTESEFPLL